MIALYDVTLLFGLALWIALTAYYLSKPYASILHPFTAYSFFHGILFVIRPALAYYREYDAIYVLYQFRPALSDKLTVLLAADLGFVCFFLAINRFGNLAFDNLKHSRIAQPPQVSRGLIIMLLIVVPLASYIMYDTMRARGAGEWSMVVDRATGIMVNTVSNGYRDNLHQMLIPVVVLLAWLGRFRLVALLPLVLFIVAQASTGSRWPFVIAIIATAGLYACYIHARWVNLKLIGLFAVAWLAFSTVVLDRGSQIREAMGLQSSGATVNNAGMRFLEPMDYANLEFFEYLVYVIPQRSGSYDYFVMNLQMFTEPVPRVLWPNKPIGAPIQNFYLFDYGRPIGMTYSLPGAGWYQAGWLGVMVWCGLFGAMFGWLYNWFVRNSKNPYVVIIYALLFALALQIFRDGILTTIGKMSLFTLLPVGLWLLFDKVFSPLQVSWRQRLRRADSRPTGTAAPLLPRQTRAQLARARLTRRPFRRDRAGRMGSPDDA